ncbi:hypothetical protein [Candidatus Babela massiliensis]|uniref:Uncharacterized protein n=1 Tax=Candidatus Babela massiliensis TaxID=673862 RepID=V6DJG1_9BACT|nr:hypothetical protein [Candidatus Babela massiliensis]CDK30656.1 hypothetical protein BABL1_gene_359 [Candidatus Babela massiliensis]
MKKVYLIYLGLCFFILSGMSLTMSSDNINFLDLIDLKNFNNLSQEINYLNTQVTESVSSKDSRNLKDIVSTLILLVDHIYNQTYDIRYFLYKHNLSSSEFSKNIAEIINKTKSYENQEIQIFLNKVLINRFNAVFDKSIVQILLDIKTEEVIDRDKIVIDAKNLNFYIIKCFEWLSIFTVSNFQGFDRGVVLDFAELYNSLETFYASLNLSQRIKLQKNPNNLLKQLKYYFYIYIKTKLNISLEHNDYNRAQEIYSYYELFNKKAKITQSEIDNLDKNSNPKDAIKRFLDYEQEQTSIDRDTLVSNLFDFSHRLISLSNIKFQ